MQMDQEVSPLVEVEQTAALLRSLNLTPPPLISNNNEMNSFTADVQRPLPTAGHPMLSLNTNLGPFRQYPSSIDPLMSRQFAFDPFFGSNSVGTPASLSPTTPDQGDGFDPAISGEYPIHHDQHAMFKKQSFDNLSHGQGHNDSPAPVISTAPSTTNTTPTKNGNSSGSKAPIIDSHTAHLSDTLTSRSIDHGLPSPPSNSNSDGSTNSTTASSLANVPLILSPPTNVGNYQFQVPPTPYLRSPSPYWRYLAETEAHSHHTAHVQPEGNLHTAVQSLVTGSARADGWVLSMPVDGGSTYQGESHPANHSFPVAHDMASWGHPANWPADLLSPPPSGLPTNFSDLASANGLSYPPSLLPADFAPMFNNAPEVSPHAALNTSSMQLNHGPGIMSWSKLAALNNAMNGLGIAMGPALTLAGLATDSTATPTPSSTVTNGTAVVSNNSTTDGNSPFKSNDSSAYSTSFSKNTSAPRDATPWQPREVQTELGYPVQRDTLGHGGVAANAGSSRSSMAPQRFPNSRAEDDEVSRALPSCRRCLKIFCRISTSFNCSSRMPSHLILSS